jgi:hypothetical protein
MKRRKKLPPMDPTMAPMMTPECGSVDVAAIGGVVGESATVVVAGGTRKPFDVVGLTT